MFSDREFHALLDDHLKGWGLRRFTDAAAYDAWQAQTLTAEQLDAVRYCTQQRHTHRDAASDCQFYDMVAHPALLPVIYSQRYDLYLNVGVRVASRLNERGSVLEFGCGVGVLLSFWACMFPEAAFVGVDRSARSIEAGRDYAARRKLSNLRFEHELDAVSAQHERFDSVIAIHAAFQAEDDPGLPSAHWDTFARVNDERIQQEAEARTGLGSRLDRLCEWMNRDGRMLVCEKTHHHGRKVLMQRALARRGLTLRREPERLLITAMGEDIEEGPLYEVERGDGSAEIPWREDLAPRVGETVYACALAAINAMKQELQLSALSHSDRENEDSTVGRWWRVGRWREALCFALFSSPDADEQRLWIASVADEEYLRGLRAEYSVSMSDSHETAENVEPDEASSLPPPDTPEPCYENHTPAAAAIWSTLEGRRVEQGRTFTQPDGREARIELGWVGEMKYLYWANTYDQRQLVIMPRAHEEWLAAYYQESVMSMMSSPRA